MGVKDGGGGGSQIMGVTVGVAVGLGAVVGGGGGSQIMGVTDGGGGGSQITGPRRQETLVLPYKTIRLRMAFCKSLGNLFHGTMVTSYREWRKVGGSA
jgi:hypothetical protein